MGIFVGYGFEEAYELNNLSDFQMLDESIRGELPEPLFHQLTITFNPWNERHWLKKEFFDAPSDPDILAITTNYTMNEFLQESDRRLFERMKKNNPRRYAVAGLGDWGVTDGLIYENWREREFKIGGANSKDDGYNIDINRLSGAFGLDFGYTNDPTAIFIGFVDLEKEKIYVYDECYEKGLSNKAIYDKIASMGYSKDRFTADSAEPKSIDELKDRGLRVKGAKKGKDSINNGIQWIQNFEIIIHPRCINFLNEISNYTWEKDKFGERMNKPIDEFNHLLDAMRYGLERYILNKKWIY